MKNKRNWIIGIILTAAAGFFALQNGIVPFSVKSTETPTISFTYTSPATFENCAFMWAYHDAPELTGKLNAAVRAIDPIGSAKATLYGEDCIYSDGHSTFSIMESDFYIYLPVEDLTNKEAFGNWMEQVLSIIIQIPRGEIQGNYGFTEFWFETNQDQLIVRVPVQEYITEAQGKTGQELFLMYHNSP